MRIIIDGDQFWPCRRVAAAILRCMTARRTRPSYEPIRHLDSGMVPADLIADLRPPSGHRHNGGMEDQPPETVTASEIAEFVFCPEAWRLAQIGAPSVNQPVREAGTGHHGEKATAERVAGGTIALGWWLVVAAVIVLGLLCMTF
jgi:hypothetical protein